MSTKESRAQKSVNDHKHAAEQLPSAIYLHHSYLGKMNAITLKVKTRSWKSEDSPQISSVYCNDTSQLGQQTRRSRVRILVVTRAASR